MLVLVDKAIQGVRDVTANLHPPALDMGIVPAIKWLAEDFTSRTGVSCDLQFVDDQPRLDDTRTLTLFRIVQESLTNIARYAQATHVVITIKSSREDITIEVRDDGKGFDTHAIPTKQSFGLMGMKERALAVSGKVEVASSPGAGTVVLVDIPLFQTNPGRRVND
jgi:signal transduction histidine kinase